MGYGNFSGNSHNESTMLFFYNADKKYILQETRTSLKYGNALIVITSKHIKCTKMALRFEKKY